MTRSGAIGPLGLPCRAGDGGGRFADDPSRFPPETWHAFANLEADRAAREAEKLRGLHGDAFQVQLAAVRARLTASFECRREARRLEVR